MLFAQRGAHRGLELAHAGPLVHPVDEGGVVAGECGRAHAEAPIHVQAEGRRIRAGIGNALRTRLALIKEWELARPPRDRQLRRLRRRRCSRLLTCTSGSVILHTLLPTYNASLLHVF